MWQQTQGTAVAKDFFFFFFLNFLTSVILAKPSISCCWYTAIDGHSSQRDETVVEPVNFIYKGSSEIQIREYTEGVVVCVSLWRHCNVFSTVRSWPLK